MTPIAVLEITLGSTTIRVSDGPIISNSRGVYNPYIQSWGGAIEHSAWEHDGGLQAPTLSATIEDPEGQYETLFEGEQSRNAIGSAAAGYLLYDDLEFSDWFQFFGGLINEISYVGRKMWLVGFRYDDFALATESGQVFIQQISSELFPDLANADPDVEGRDIPLIYGANYAVEGAVECPYISTDGDDDSSTAPHRYLYCAGHIQDVDEIFVGGASSVGSPVKDTDWFWTERGGAYFTEVGFASAQTDPVTVNGHGFTDSGEGSTTLGDLITNKAKQIEHLLTNFIFNRWTSGDFFSSSNVPIDTVSISALESYLDAVGQESVDGSNVITSIAAYAILREFMRDNEIAVWWTEAGQLRFKVRDWGDADVYLDNNSPANWPWFQTGRDGRGENPIFPVTGDGRLLSDRVTFRGEWTPAGGFSASRTARDFDRPFVSGQEVESKWLHSEGDNVPEFDAPSRRLRRLRLPARRLHFRSHIAFLDEHLLEPLLISDPNAPSSDGGGWGDDTVWKPRLHSIVNRALDLSTKTLACVAEPEKDYRATWWDSGAGENLAARGDGVAILTRTGSAQSIRTSNAWVPNLAGKLVRVASGLAKRTELGILLEGESENVIANASFLDGAAGWTPAGSPALQTSVKLFTDETADTLGGTNQTYNLPTTAGPTESSIRRNTSVALTGSGKVTISVWCIDNSGGPIRLLIQNTTTSNYLVSGSTWQAGATNVTTGWSATGGGWVRQTLEFTMEATGSTLLVQIKSPSGAGNDSNVAHIQVEDNAVSSSVITGRNASGAVTREADRWLFDNDSASGYTFRYFEQGTFRCVYRPLWSTGSEPFENAPIVAGDDNNGPSSVSHFALAYDASAAGFDVYWSGVTGLQHAISLTAGTEYYIVVTWIGANQELGYAQGTLIFEIYNGSSWEQAIDTTQTQSTEDADAQMYIGHWRQVISPFTPSAWGYLRNIEFLPFVMKEGERRAFP